MGTASNYNWDVRQEYPWGVVRVLCDLCGRGGTYRLPQLSAKDGAEIPLDQLLNSLALDSRSRPRPGQRHPGKYETKCGAYFPDLVSPKPPDLPPGMMKLRVAGGGKG